MAGFSPFGLPPEMGASAAAKPGIMAPPPYNPNQRSSPGLAGPQQPYGAPQQWNPQMPQAAPGQDRISQGIDEQFADQVVPQLMGQGGMGQYANAVAGKFNAPRNFTPGGGGLSNRAEQAYQDYRGAGLEAGLDPYYERARQRTSKDVNTGLAARGLHGSSAGMQMMNDAQGALSAEQANREGDFDLQRLGLGGQLGRSADISAEGMGAHDLQRSLAKEGNELGWLQTGADIAGAASNEELARLGLGSGIASGAAGAKEGRLQNKFNNEAFMALQAQQAAERWYQQMFGTDAGLRDEATGAALGYPNQGLADSRYDANKVTQDTGLVTGLLSNLGLGGIL